MQCLAVKGYKFIVISNQAGIGRGMVEKEKVEEINLNMTRQLKNKGIEILDTLICPHHWDDNCDCRKPKTGNYKRSLRL